MTERAALDGSAICGIGVDAVDVERFRGVLERRPGLAERLFTPAERDYAAGGRDPAARLAARFAAKEAVLKALGVGIGSAGMQEVEVVRGEDGRPLLSLSGRAAVLAHERGVRHWHVSLTHTDLVAVASVVAEGAGAAPGGGAA